MIYRDHLNCDFELNGTYYSRYLLNKLQSYLYMYIAVEYINKEQ